jgi:hypothetical protein
MDEMSRHRERNAILFLLVCAIHAVFCWLLFASRRVVTFKTRARAFELLVLPSTQAPVPTVSRTTQQSAVPRGVNRPPPRVVNLGKAAVPSIQSIETSPYVDWDAELLRASRAAADAQSTTARKDFGFPMRSPTMRDCPQFDWDYARTHRVESFPEGGMIIHLNDNCVLVLNPFPFPLCSPLKRKANGELFKHMRDPDKPGEADIP